MPEERGASIPGSKYVRDYCAGCKEPIRVKSIETKNICQDCRDAGVRISQLKEEVDGWWERLQNDEW